MFVFINHVLYICHRHTTLGLSLCLTAAGVHVPPTCVCRCSVIDSVSCCQLRTNQRLCAGWGVEHSAVERCHTDLCWCIHTADFTCFGWAGLFTGVCRRLQASSLSCWLQYSTQCWTSLLFSMVHLVCRFYVTPSYTWIRVSNISFLSLF